MTIELNGRPRQIDEGATLTAVLALLDLPPDARGVAVAVDAEVVPRRQWPERTVGAGARVEVLTAMQGG